jgi:hypothetical protein
VDEIGDTLDLVDLACVLIARNGADGKMTARICADADGKKGVWDSRTAVPQEIIE